MLLNYDRAMETMQREKIDALLAATPENVLYLTDNEGHLTTGLFHFLHSYRPSYFAILPANKDIQPTYLTPLGTLGFMVDQPTWMQVRVWGDHGPELPPAEQLDGDARAYIKIVEDARKDLVPGPAIKALSSTLRELGLGNARIAIDDPVLAPQLQEDGFSAANLLNGYEVFRTIRAVKTPEEIDRLHKASDANDNALKALFDTVQPGVTWGELKNAYEYKLMDQGAVPGFWGHGSGPAPYRFNLFQTGSPILDARVKEGDVLKLDVGCTYRNYWADTNGTMVWRGKHPEWLPKAATALREAREAYSEHLRPGVPMSKAISALEEVAWKHGFTDFKAAWGHGLGLQCYDYPTPRIDRNSKELWETGMVFNVEGGPVRINEGSHSLENTYVITRDGFERWSAHDGLLKERA
jgi:Xaa-Pro dipeptidase